MIIRSTLLALPLLLLATSAAAQGPFERRLAGLSAVPAGEGKTEIAAYVQVLLFSPVTAQLDLSTEVVFEIDGVEIGRTPAPFDAVPGTGTASCSIGPCIGFCGTPGEEDMACATYIPTGIDCGCAAMITAPFPGGTYDFQPGEVLTVRLVPAPGAEPGGLGQDILIGGGLDLETDGAHWQREVRGVEVVPADTSTFDVFFCVTIEVGECMSGSPTPADLSREIVLDVDGVPVAAELEPGTILITETSGDVTYRQFEDVPLEPGSLVDVQLHDMPSSLPSLASHPDQDLSFIVPSLFADVTELSVQSGGVQTLSLIAGADHAGDLYLLLSSKSGTVPGFPIDGNVLPLNVDGLFLYTLNNPNVPPYDNTLSFLDGSGRSTATFKLPPASSTSLVGVTYHHAYGVLGLGPVKVTHTSNAVPLTFVP